MAPSVVVTGASGFLGQAVLRALQARGVAALGLARRPGGTWQQVSAYTQAPQAKVIVHLAETSHRGTLNRAGEAAAAALEATLRTLLARGYPRFVYASSAAVYGDEATTPRRESDPVSDTDLYARMKLAHEDLVTSAPGVSGVVARLTNLYGTGMSPDNVLSALLRQFPGDGTLQVLDDAPVRDFLHVDDAAAALVAMALGGASGTFNVGSGTGTSVRELARVFCAAADGPPRPLRPLQASGRRSCLVVDASAARAAFGWRPQTALAEGLRQLLDSSPPSLIRAS